MWSGKRETVKLANVPEQAADSLSILRRISGEDKTAAIDCVDIYGHMIWTIAKKLTSSTQQAEEATLEIFRDIWRYDGRFDSKEFSEEMIILMIAYRRLLKFNDLKAAPETILTSKGKVNLTSKGKVKTNGVSEAFRDTVRELIDEEKLMETQKPILISGADEEDADSYKETDG